MVFGKEVREILNKGMKFPNEYTIKAIDAHTYYIKNKHNKCIYQSKYDKLTILLDEMPNNMIVDIAVNQFKTVSCIDEINSLLISWGYGPMIRYIKTIGKRIQYSYNVALVLDEVNKCYEVIQPGEMTC